VLDGAERTVPRASGTPGGGGHPERPDVLTLDVGVAERVPGRSVPHDLDGGLARTLEAVRLRR
jgi:hypothetical protein